jgi:SAM-dependent methyltransferase
MSVRKLIERQSAFTLFRPILAEDHSKQVTAEQLARAVSREFDGDAMVLDLGCGEGNSKEFFEETYVRALWFGVDIDDSPEARARKCEGGNFATFDGINLPYRDATFDLIFSRQVLEHVRHPDRLLRDVARVLKPGGHYVGSVSYLEPYHSYSIFNFTPYGVMRVFEEAGLDVLELRPGVDGPTLMIRQMVMGAAFLKFCFRRSPFNLAITLLGHALGLRHQHINFLKLQFAGHIGFVARRPIGPCVPPTSLSRKEPNTDIPKGSRSRRS